MYPPPALLIEAIAGELSLASVAPVGRLFDPCTASSAGSACQPGAIRPPLVVSIAADQTSAVGFPPGWMPPITYIRLPTDAVPIFASLLGSVLGSFFQFRSRP